MALILPSGAVVTAGSTATQQLQWKTTDDPLGEPTEVAGLLLPQPDRHHLMYFKQVPRGTYRVRTLGPTGGAQFRALFLPYEQGWPRYMEGLYSRKPPPGKVLMRFWMPVSECFVGDAIDIMLELEGDTGRESAAIEVFYESPRRPVNLTFSRVSNGRYRALIVASQAGPLHLTIRASGQTASGFSFSGLCSRICG